MTKRLVDYVHGLVKAVLLDYCDHFPDDREEVERDLTRLTFLVEKRGLAVFTLDFPSALKHFDKCLSEEAYTQSKLPLTAPKAGSVIPKLFWGILIRVFDRHGRLRHDADVVAVATIRQVYAVGKKLRLDCERSKVYETVADFFRVESSLPEADQSWGQRQGSLFDRDRCRVDSYRGRSALPGVHNRFRSVDDRGEQLWCRAVGITFDAISTTLGVFNPTEWLPKHGPGAVSDQKRYQNKYRFPHWSERLDAVFPLAEFAYANYSLWASEHSSGPKFDENLSSKLITVPKTQKGPRLIASEPVCNQYCQQALWRFFRERTEGSWIGGFIRFSDQTFNQEGARRASKHGLHWTVDLSAASDRVSTRLVERFFGGNPTILEALKASRTASLRQDIDKKSPSHVELKKFSTMGSACTFPVESLVFLGIALAAVCLARGHVPSVRRFKAYRGEVRVFGDDLIVPSDAGEVLEALLTWFDFEVNESKTHRNGYFRESCGLDAFRGHDVTPAYILTLPDPKRPDSVISNVESSNNFYTKGWWRAAELIRSTVDNRGIPVVSAESGHFGYRTYCRYRVEDIHTGHITRWNPRLHREETLVVQPNARVSRSKPGGHEALLQYFVESPSPSENWESGYVSSPPRVNLRRKWVPTDELTSNDVPLCGFDTFIGVTAARADEAVQRGIRRVRRLTRLYRESEKTHAS